MIIMKKGCPYGTHRVISPVGVLPQPADKVDNTMEIYEGMPHVFCGTLVLLLVVLFFLNRQIPIRIRLTALAVISILLATACVLTLCVSFAACTKDDKKTRSGKV